MLHKSTNTGLYMYAINYHDTYTKAHIMHIVYTICECGMQKILKILRHRAYKLMSHQSLKNNSNIHLLGS